MGRKIPLLNHDVTFRVKTGRFINIQDSYRALSRQGLQITETGFSVFWPETIKVQGFSQPCLRDQARTTDYSQGLEKDYQPETEKGVSLLKHSKDSLNPARTIKQGLQKDSQFSSLKLKQWFLY